jgi:hypothetical protein
VEESSLPADVGDQDHAAHQISRSRATRIPLSRSRSRQILNQRSERGERASERRPKAREEDTARPQQLAGNTVDLVISYKV